MNRNNKTDVQNDILGDLGVKSEKSEFDTMSAAALSEEEQRLDLELKRLELEERREAQQKRQHKKAQQKAEVEAKLQAVRQFLADRESVQRRCNHKKGGLGRDGVILGQGTDDYFAFLKHQKPDGRWLVLCQRCLAEWHPEDPWTGKPASIIGGMTYEQALMAPTDNSPSASVVFKFEDNRTPEQIAAARYKPPRDEQGNEIEDTLALPAAGKFSAPPIPRRSIR